MSDVLSALPGSVSSGFVRVEEAGLRGMIVVRGDLGSERFRSAVEEVAAAPMPDPRRASGGADGGLLWMSPDELLLLCPHGEAPAKAARLGESLAGEHHLALDVSDARAVFRLTGPDPHVREVLAKLTPADLRPESLPVGEVRRTRLAQVAAAFRFVAPGEAEVICFRSVARYVFDLLANASRPGSEVGQF